jgi:uncharacterized protein YdeI (YjbR/CyaY-like superfamily)
MKKVPVRTFHAKLEPIDSPLKWVIIRIPINLSRAWGARGRVRVKGAINGFAFRTSLFPARSGGHMMLVNKKMQAGGRVASGMSAQFRMQLDTEPRPTAAPPEFQSFLNENRALRKWYDQLNPSTRRDVTRWVTDVKSPEARQRRAEQLAERFLATMEAERELPPILQIELARNPHAREGWNSMSPIQKRRELFGIFYYREPAARARRVAKVIQSAIERSKKNRNAGLI